MRRALLRRASGWLPAVLVLVIVLGVGARLILLSVQSDAIEARAAATAAARNAARDFTAQLQRIADLASVAGAPRLPVTGIPSRTRSAGRFYVAADGTVIRALDAPAATVEGLMREWRSANPPLGALRGLMLGPTRQGSQWILAAFAPKQPEGQNGPTEWSVAYADLDHLLANIQLPALTRAYDVQVAQATSAGGDPRIIIGSRTGVLDDPATVSIGMPVGFEPAERGSGLQLSLRPRAGWFPPGRIAAQIGLLAVIAWLLAFGVHDLMHHLRHLRERIGVSQRRVRSLRLRLTSEIEQRQELQKSIDHARYHDGFTGLPNRRYFADQVDRALRELRGRRRQRVGIILADIARFKLINDTLGHTAGDDLMVQAARRFAAATATLECVLARWGEDQFAVLLLDVGSSDAALVFADVLHDALREPFDLRRHRITVSAIMGVTTFSESGPQRVEDALREADIALSAARRSDTQRTVLYVPSMGGDAASMVSIEADLHVALARNELRLLFQPIVDLRSYRMVGAEVLLRWRHPVEGLLPPAKFLAIAEEAGLMVVMTQRIIERVCRLAALWRRIIPASQTFYFSVNLSASVLRDPQFADFVARILQEAQVPAAVLKFEVTESALIGDVGATREVLQALHRLGVQLMLDDFGTGFSSLNHLQLYPLDFVKIDRPFLTRQQSDRANAGMISAILQMTPAMGLGAIAEMIETQEAATALKDMGCEFGQGYFFSEPVSAEEALKYLRGGPIQPRSTQARSEDPASRAVEGCARAAPAGQATASASSSVAAAPMTAATSAATQAATDNSPTRELPMLDDSPTALLPAMNEDDTSED
jgi:diguanylate cyclase (GGDEF)-like protein